MAVTMLEQAEWEMLHAHFLLKNAEARHQDHSVPSADLLDPLRCADLLDSLTAMMGSPSRRVTASLLGKRIAFLTTGAGLYSMSMYDKGLDLSLENCHVEYRHANQRWQSGMPLADMTPSLPQQGQRDEWRKQMVARLFAGNLSRLWQSLSSVARVPLPILWENTAVRVYALYERRMAGSGCVDTQRRIREDFDFLVRDAGAELFGAACNPLAEFFRPLQYTSHTVQPLRIRRTCCYYYLASSPREYCSVCPLHHR